MKAKEYFGDRPCINYVWVMLDRLGPFVPKLRPAVKMPPKQSLTK
jgi:hypothetical protein